MLMMGNVWAVFCFEWRRALTAPRIAWWLVLTLFPVLMVFFIRLVPGELPKEPWSIFLFVLIPMLVSILGTFLWTTSAVSSELEQQSWTYLTVRPGGRCAVLLGKYFAAVPWVTSALVLSLLLSMTIAARELAADDTRRIAITLTKLSLLSCPAYAAVYLLLGTLFTRRSMVMAVVYTLIFELIIGNMVPAVINKLTVQYRLRALLFRWAEIDVGRADEFVSAQLIGTTPAWQHVAILIGYTFTVVSAAVWIVRHREYAALGDV